MRFLAAATLLIGFATSAYAKECSPEAAYQGGAPISAFPHGIAPPRLNEGKTLSKDVRNRLEAGVTQAAEATGARDFGASVLYPGGAWKSADAEKPFFWASTGKLITAIVILQLVEEGRLSLDAPIARFVEGVAAGEAITIEHLLHHTSGLPSANEIVRERGAPLPATLGDEIELLNRHDLLFCPGTGWRYSNSGYALLGAVIEQLEETAYAEAVSRRIAEPLGLTSLRIVTARDDAGFAPLAPTTQEEPFHPSQAGAAGGLVATPEDMSRLMAALLAGKLVSRDTLTGMGAKAYPMFDAGTFYGLGLMVYRFPGGDGTSQQWIGHSGGVPGAKAVLAYDTGREVIVAVALTGDGSAEASANLLMRRLAEK